MKLLILHEIAPVMPKIKEKGLQKGQDSREKGIKLTTETGREKEAKTKKGQKRRERIKSTTRARKRVVKIMRNKKRRKRKEDTNQALLLRHPFLVQALIPAQVQAIQTGNTRGGSQRGEKRRRSRPREESTIHPHLND